MIPSMIDMVLDDWRTIKSIAVVLDLKEDEVPTVVFKGRNIEQTVWKSNVKEHIVYRQAK